MPRIQTVVSDEQKERWSEYVENNPEYDSVSDLIRSSVEHEISTEGNGTGGNPEEINDILQGIDSLEAQLAQTEDQIKALRTENMEKDDFADFIYSDFEPLISRSVESSVEDKLWDWTYESIIIPNLDNAGLTRDTVIDMEPEELAEFIEEASDNNWRRM
jgi:Arc/MetJ-type ribon-helix-helix transcriptional regulator